MVFFNSDVGKGHSSAHAHFGNIAQHSSWFGRTNQIKWDFLWFEIYK